MTSFIESILEIHLGYTVICVCTGVGFFFLRKVDKGEIVLGSGR